MLKLDNTKCVELVSDWQKGQKDVDPKPGFLQYIHAFRGIAILLIVGSHVFYGLRDENTAISIINSSVRGTSILFLFISGYLFQHLSYKFTVKHYYLNKLKYVILPYLIISTPIILLKLYPMPAYALSHFDNANISLAYQVLIFLTTGKHLLPFWFIPVIVLFYSLAPLLYQLDKKGKVYYFLPLFIVVSLLVPRTELNDIPRLFIHFFSVYLFGMFMSHYKERVWTFSSRYWKLVTLLIISISVVVVLLPYDSYEHLSFMYLHKMLLCWFFIYFLTRYADKIPNQLSLLAEVSFGIYFIHYIFAIAYRKGLNYIFEYNFDSSPFVWLIIWTFGIFSITLVCVITIVLIKRIFGIRSRLLIGS